ncbi:RNA-directed DNA polymerase from mobile element jockey [Eumeta japonica]|uniref:RNA-directed DNA polymerase from mobile element jockey n=1 Tax=Eumeta variegata TaxID=151549 RepID=A0A4C1X9P3_EUMVA|nr:RNA-directed DNA polymerase from mobile element jockey [Eumeta japonica]
MLGYSLDQGGSVHSRIGRKALMCKLWPESHGQLQRVSELKISPKPTNRTHKNRSSRTSPGLNRDDTNFPTLRVINFTRNNGDGFLPAPVVSSNPRRENQLPTTAPELAREAIRRGPPSLPSSFVAMDPVALFGEDIKTVMSVLRTIKTSEISEFDYDLRLCSNAENKLNVFVKYHHLMGRKHLKPHRLMVCPIAGYVQLRTDKTYAWKEGTALFYKRFLLCCLIEIPPLVNMEATGCRFAMTGHGTLVIVSIYLPATNKLLRIDLEILVALGDAIMLFDDFNSKNPRWSCPVINYSTNKLIRPQSRLDFEIIAPPTSINFPDTPSNKPSTLNIAITKGVAPNVSHIETLHRFISDHCPVLLKMGPHDGGSSNTTIKITVWNRVCRLRLRKSTIPF